MSVDLSKLYDVIDATWPAAELRRVGPWAIRESRGGGQRVSAATTDQIVKPSDIALAEQAMRDLDQTPLFMIRAGQDDLDKVLAERHYQVVDPVDLFLGPIDPYLGGKDPRALVFSIWPPLAIQIDLWADGGIDAARVAVMTRATVEKTSILGRYDQTPAASAYVAVSDGVAMLHALEVPESCRRKGVGRMVTEHAARWAASKGAKQLSVLCTQANTGAQALYSSLGLTIVGQYHYRKLMEKPSE